MSIALLGATGRLGGMAQHFWPDEDVTFHGRAVAEVPAGTRCLIDLRGVVPERGDLRQNTAIAKAALDHALAHGIRHVLLASTAAVYGRPAGPLTPNMAAPISDYGRAKRAMEQMAAGHPQPSTVLRIGNVIGADAIVAGWCPGFALDTFADGSSPSRSCIGPDTLSRVLHHLSQVEDLPPILNVACPGSLRFDALLRAAGRAWVPRAAPDGAIPDVTLDTLPLEALFDFAPEECTPEGMIAQWRQMAETS